MSPLAFGGVELNVLTLVFIIGILNFAVGFALAAFWEPPEWKWGRALGTPRRASSAPGESRRPFLLFLRRFRPRWLPRAAGALKLAADPPAAADRPTACAEMREAAAGGLESLEGLPDAWAAEMAQIPFPPASLREAVLWVIHMGLVSHRRTLRSLAQRCHDAHSLPDLAAEAREALDRWEQQLAEWTAWTRDHRDWLRPGGHGGLEESLASWGAAPRVPLTAGAATGGVSAHREEVTSALHDVDAVIGRALPVVEQALAAELRETQRLSEIPGAIRRETESNALTPLGLQALLDDWLLRDPERIRMVSGVLVSVDGCAAWPAQYGSGASGGCLAETSRLLQRLVRRDRGFDHVARLRDDVFLLFLGDTALRNGVNAAERIRQSVASAVFRAGNQQIEVTVRCVVTEWTATETAESWLGRMEQALADPAAAARNQTLAVDDQGLQPIAAVRYSVPRSEIQVPTGESPPAPVSAA